MKKFTITVGLLVLVLFSAYTVPNDVIYSEGDATVKYQEGYVEDVFIGDVYDTGDTVTTGYDGFVELDQDGLVLKINPDTVFTLQEKEEKGEKAGVFSLALGSIKFRYDRITGKEPMIQTPSCVAGARGTEFSVYAGADGSALIVVDSGLVEVESEGKAVQLTTDEGVEVQPGKPPGDKFAVKVDEIEYKTWNEEKIRRMLSDPADAVENILKRLNFYIQNTSEYYDLYNEFKERLDTERQNMVDLLNKEGEEAAKKYDAEVVSLIRDNTRASFLNYRYYSLAALSLRRYVAGRMYVLLKAQYITKANDSSYQQFLNRYSDILSDFESSIVPYLVEADI
ncbi:MAG: FecR domain-containing protein [Spirochaetaceae bacterium]|nr:MAG: FecR domain-containing protein [Spirochaetaceae bacterium]